MALFEYGETWCGIVEPLSLPTPDNDNQGLAPPWRTPAEVLQMIRRWRQEMREELAADFKLRACPTHRRHWETLIEMEKCALWHYYGVRQG